MKVFNYIDLNIYYGDLQFGWKIGWKKKQTAILPDVDVVFFLVKLYNILSALLLAAIHLFQIIDLRFLESYLQLFR